MGIVARTLAAGLMVGLGAAGGVPDAAGQTPIGLSTEALTRCAGRIGSDIRKADPAFPTFGIDGVPWLTVDHTEEVVGNQSIATTLTGTGWRRRRDGTSVPYRFTCMLDAQGQAVMFHAAPLQRTLGDVLPPARIVEGAAAYLQRMALPRGTELQVQLLDVTGAKPELLAEQVVRSGWQVPIPFELRLPKDLPLANRKLEITARFVQARQPLFELREPRLLTAQDLDRFILLSLDRAGAPAPAPTAPPRRE